MEKITKPLEWTTRALNDLNKLPEFNSEILGFKKAEAISDSIINKAEILENPECDYTKIGAIDESFSHLKYNYRKLIEGHYKITYREGRKAIYINRVFDTRQNPNKNR